MRECVRIYIYIYMYVYVHTYAEKTWENGTMSEREREREMFRPAERFPKMLRFFLHHFKDEFPIKHDSV